MAAPALPIVDLMLARLCSQKVSGVVSVLRSILFVPGDRPERFPKAIESGADAICLDLEDAVQPSDKAAARRSVAAAVACSAAATRLVVRINSLRSRHGLEDLLALEAVARRPASIMIPKIESASEAQTVREVLSSRNDPVTVMGLIETSRGLDAIDAIAAAPGLAALILGIADLSAEMGISMEWEPMLYARYRTVCAAHRARVAAVDGAWTKIDDSEGLQAEAARAVELGFGGKICIHPGQVSIVHAALSPSAEAIAHAREVIAASSVAAHGVTVVRGRMIDRPIVEAARRTLARAGLEH
jgi:citrate lyase beta subunit